MVGFSISIHQTAAPITGLDDPRLATEAATYEALGVGMTSIETLAHPSSSILALLDRLIARGKAKQLTYAGYPNIYLARAGDLTRYARVKTLSPDEWVVVEAIDQS